MMNKIVDGRTMTGLRNWLNETYVKKGCGTEFTAQDVQQYIRRGRLPRYLGGNRIVLKKSNSDVKLYSVLNNEIIRK